MQITLLSLVLLLAPVPVPGAADSVLLEEVPRLELVRNRSASAIVRRARSLADATTCDRCSGGGQRKVRVCRPGSGRR